MNQFLFVTDLDHTLVGDDDALELINQKLHEHRQEYGTKIVYSTGRSLTSYRQLTSEKSLLEPDALITAVGTEIYYSGDHDQPDSAWSTTLAQNWDREQVVATAAHFSDLLAQPDSEQRPFKVSYYLSETVADQVIEKLASLLRDRTLDVKLIYSGGKDLDILPANGGKGYAMQFVREQWGFSPEKTVVCGDSGNDIALFSVGKERGILVGNALPELRRWYEENPGNHRYLAQAKCAAGILEGLNYFGFF